MALAAAPAWPQNYSDIWWNPDDPGWGLTLADHETQMFAVWYTYQFNGQPAWFVIPGGTFSQDKRFFSGDLYQATGPAYDAPFDPKRVALMRIGNASIDFAPSGVASGTALFTYNVGPVAKTKPIQRLPFGNAAPDWGTDATDIWWNPEESGWGLALAQHGNNLFGAWYTYGHDGLPLFIVMPGGTFDAPNRISGTLYTTTDPYYAYASFDGGQGVIIEVGHATIVFSETTSASATRTLTFTSTVNGFTQTKTLTPLRFGRTDARGDYTAAIK